MPELVLLLLQPADVCICLRAKIQRTAASLPILLSQLLWQRHCCLISLSRPGNRGSWMLEFHCETSCSFKTLLHFILPRICCMFLLPAPPNPVSSLRWIHTFGFSGWVMRWCHGAACFFCGMWLSFIPHLLEVTTRAEEWQERVCFVGNDSVLFRVMKREILF